MPASLALTSRDPALRRRAFAVVATATAAIVAAVFAARGAGAGWWWLHWIAKPMATGLILWMAWRTALPVSDRYRRWICAGITCSLIGDVLLMLPIDLFVPGLLAFLFGHICFFRALLTDSRLAARPLLLLGSPGFGALNLWLLWDSIAIPLRVPVTIYVIVLTGMAGQALSRAGELLPCGDLRADSARLAALGAMTFMLSDSLLAWNRFHAPIPLSSVWVLSTYYLALWWIARSVQRSGTPDPSRVAT